MIQNHVLPLYHNYRATMYNINALTSTLATNNAMEIAEHDIDTSISLSNSLLMEEDHKYSSNTISLEEEKTLMRSVACSVHIESPDAFTYIESPTGLEKIKAYVYIFKRVGGENIGRGDIHMSLSYTNSHLPHFI